MQTSLLLSVQQHLAAGGQVWLGLDYDGTLVPIAHEPGLREPDSALCALLAGLASTPQLNVAIVSGRPLTSLQALFPYSGLTLAGVYGLEVQKEGGTRVLRVDASLLHPQLEMIKSDWFLLTHGRVGYFIEDKGLSLALHADGADQAEAMLLLSVARSMATERSSPLPLRILEGARYLEVAPAMAHKGETVRWLLDENAHRQALPVYVGDDERDEEAFDVVRQRGGIPILVGKGSGSTEALAQFPSCEIVRTWLQLMLQAAQAQLDCQMP